jgi:solute carrier family 25 (mitochondrial citrate transporter), member 1
MSRATSRNRPGSWPVWWRGVSRVLLLLHPLRGLRLHCMTPPSPKKQNVLLIFLLARLRIDDAKGAKRFRSATHGIQLLIREQGIKGIYQGLVPTTIKQSATSAVRMGSYNMLKENAKYYSVPLNGVTTFGIGSIAGIITVYATQPFDTVKTRVQGTERATLKDAVTGVFRESGPRGFWKGSTMRLGRLFLSGGIVFSVYEQVAGLLSSAR